MINDRISIIVPVYNLENYIAKTLESICNQTYKNIEIIVVDDGSKDNSWNVICDCAKFDDRIVPIHQENGGVTDARLNGVKNATGNWIGFVDGDDLIDEDMYEFLINNAYKYNADISHCGYRMVFDGGRANCFYGTNQVFEQDNKKGLIDLLDGSVVEPGLCNKLYSKTVFDKANLSKAMDFSVKNNEDLLMNFILFSKSKKSVFVDECKYKYIVRQGSASRSKNQHTFFDPIKVKRNICELAPEELKNKANAVYIRTCINSYNGLVFSGADYSSERNQIRGLIKESKSFLSLLSKKDRLIGAMILKIPFVYKPVYLIYTKFFQEKKYS